MPTTNLKRPAVKGLSNWGTGVQPERAPRRLDQPTPVAPVRPVAPGRNIGSFTNKDLTPRSAQMNPLYAGDAAPAAPSPVAPVRRVAPRPVAPVTPAAPDLTGLAPGSIGMQNALNNAGVYAPGSFGAQNAAANGTGYRAPQQTERANPLSGDNNVPMESTTTAVAKPPFIQRGARTPAGSDAAPIKDTLTQDANIDKNLAGNVGGSGLFKRKFATAASAGKYDSYVKRLFSPDTGTTVN